MGSWVNLPLFTQSGVSEVLGELTAFLTLATHTQTTTAEQLTPLWKQSCSLVLITHHFFCENTPAGFELALRDLRYPFFCFFPSQKGKEQ